MITPEQIKKQARNWYPDFLKAMTMGMSFFPKEIRFGKIRASDTLKNHAALRKSLDHLRASSKHNLGYGYQIEFVEKRDQKIGTQLFPQKIYFENAEDYLRFLGKTLEYKKFQNTVQKIRKSIPELADWMAQYPVLVVTHAEKWNNLLKVCRYFLNNPRPKLYIRELPIDVPTKFIEENRGILRLLFDWLIAGYSNPDETDFEKRFNLKITEPSIRLRILDSDISQSRFSGLTDLTLPQNEFCCLDLPCQRVFILENKTNFSNIFNFLTLPQIKKAIAIFGRGFGLGLLKNAAWLKDKEIYYWGDIDAQGFQILSQLRSYFPQTRSFLMDQETFDAFADFRINGTASSITRLTNLTREENHLFEFLLQLKEKARLEQEKIPHAFVIKKLGC